MSKAARRGRGWRLVERMRGSASTGMTTDRIMALTRDAGTRKRRRRSMRYTVIIERGRDAGYVAICPALPGCVSQGRTTSAARKNIREAIEAYIEALLEDGLRVPTEAGRETVEIRIAAR